jgi:hypothetical protein
MHLLLLECLERDRNEKDKQETNRFQVGQTPGFTKLSRLWSIHTSQNKTTKTLASVGLLLWDNRPGVISPDKSLFVVRRRLNIGGFVAGSTR